MTDQALINFLSLQTQMRKELTRESARNEDNVKQLSSAIEEV